MKIECLSLGPLGTNCYVVGCEATAKGFIVDAADEPQRILRVIDDNGLQMEAIFQTHGHPDHTAALAEVAAATGADIYLHPAEVAMLDTFAGSLRQMFGDVAWPLAHCTYEEGDVISVGELRVQVLHTPGHTPGSVCLLVDEVLFSGDALFAGGVGRWDLPGGDWEALARSLKRLATLPDATEALPGHGPASTIRNEKRSNPYLIELSRNA